MHFYFNNQFIKVKKTLEKIAKIPKKIFCFVLVSGITNLYVNVFPILKRYFF
jgi:hypothetical protein